MAPWERAAWGGLPTHVLRSPLAPISWSAHCIAPSRRLLSHPTPTGIHRHPTKHMADEESEFLTPCPVEGLVCPPRPLPAAHGPRSCVVYGKCACVHGRFLNMRLLSPLPFFLVHC